MHPPFVNERGVTRWRISTWLADLLSARGCLVLACLISAIHACVWRLADPEAVMQRFWLSGMDAIWQEPWRFISYAFIHGNPAHLAINMAGLLIIGSKVERIAGRGTTLKVFLSGVMVGGVIHLLAAPTAQRDLSLVGASGGISALLLWLTTVSPELETWPIRVSGKNLGRGILLAELGLLALSWWIPVVGFQPVAHACHLGGSLAGWAWGKRVFRRLPTRGDLQKERARRESANGPEGDS